MNRLYYYSRTNTLVHTLCYNIPVLCMQVINTLY